MLECLATLKGPDLIHNMVISPTEHTSVHEHTYKEITALHLSFVFDPKKDFSLCLSKNDQCTLQ